MVRDSGKLSKQDRKRLKECLLYIALLSLGYWLLRKLVPETAPHFNFVEALIVLFAAVCVCVALYHSLRGELLDHRGVDTQRMWLYGPLGAIAAGTSWSLSRAPGLALESSDSISILLLGGLMTLGCAIPFAQHLISRTRKRRLLPKVVASTTAPQHPILILEVPLLARADFFFPGTSSQSCSLKLPLTFPSSDFS